MRLSRLLAKEGNRCELWRRWAKKSDSPVAGKTQADQCLANEHHPKIGRTWGSKAGSVSLEINASCKVRAWMLMEPQCAVQKRSSGQAIEGGKKSGIGCDGRTGDKLDVITDRQLTARLLVVRPVVEVHTSPVSLLAARSHPD